MYNFKLNEKQQEKLYAWHNDCEHEGGAIGGKISYIFTPTGLGTCLVVKCICGAEIDLTESEYW